MRAPLPVAHCVGGTKGEGRVTINPENPRVRLTGPCVRAAARHFYILQPRCAQVGKKKSADVQFYAEVMDSVQTIEGGRRSMYDPDELEEEQREREIRNRVRPAAGVLGLWFQPL